MFWVTRPYLGNWTDPMGFVCLSDNFLSQDKKMCSHTKIERKINPKPTISF